MDRTNFLWLGAVIVLSAGLVWLLQDVISLWMLSILLLLLGGVLGNLQRKLRKDK